MSNTSKRSPFFYVGDKYKLMPQLNKLFPNKIKTYFEPFLGGGSSVLYTKAEYYILNDIDSNVIRLHKFISSYAGKEEFLLKELGEIIKKYDLSCSYLGVTAPDYLKEKHKKTYYAKYNKKSYINLRTSFNKNNSTIELYLLLIYGFNRMIRFNKKGEFNVPVGNIDFNKNVVDALYDYLEFVKHNNLEFNCLDYQSFLEKQKFNKGDFIYFDPPYLISNSEYNKLWNESDEKNLYSLLDRLDKRNIKFGLSNIVHHKGQTNELLKDWMANYNIYNVKSNYISRYDNTIKENSKEVFITNYEKSST